MCLWFGMPANAAETYAAFALVAVGAVVEVYVRRKQASLSIEAVHRAAELPAQASTPTDPQLLAALARLGITSRTLHAAWSRCAAVDCVTKPTAAPAPALVVVEDDDDPITLVDGPL